MGATRDHPRAMAIAADSSAEPGDAAGLGLQSDQCPAWALLVHFGERLSTHEVALFQLHSPAEAGLVRIPRLIHVMAVEAKRCLQACCVSGSKTGRQDAGEEARRQERVPHPA